MNPLLIRFIFQNKSLEPENFNKSVCGRFNIATFACDVFFRRAPLGRQQNVETVKQSKLLLSPPE